MVESIEIGSAFHRIAKDFGSGINYSKSGIFVFSGRTAIECVLGQLSNVKTALLPSYCCESMIEPFKRAGVEVYFYPVNYENGLTIDLKIPSWIDVVMLCNYFGFNTSISGIEQLSEFSGTVIEDVTHSFFSSQQYHPQAQYLVASLRKWEPIYCGGYCIAVNGALDNVLLARPPEEFVSLMANAMDLKKEYLDNPDEPIKTRFLSLFRESNNWLAEHYSGLSIDPWSREYLSSVDIDKQRIIRRTNAHVLYQGLKDKVQFMFLERDMDCPLFIPIMLPERRDSIRQQLINNQIYCPVHWPKPRDCESNIYDMELSLVCDQRYTEEDMNKIVEVISEVI